MQHRTEHTTIHPRTGLAIQKEQIRQALPPGQLLKARWGRWLFLCCALFALLLATFTIGPIQHSFAASAAPQTCLNASMRNKAQACNGQDPILSHCVSGAKTILQIPILNDAEQQVGRLEIRFSAVCQTYWGRAFTSLPNVRIVIALQELSSDPAGQYEGPAPEVYSNMYYGAQPGFDVKIFGTPNHTPPSASIAGTNE